ncbi:MAG: DEAD/DEAH box helicase [Planctomycetota bacterium]|jgi:DNA excision repair protein ERCC-3|nr:DEAD/DEAH box helicase [Planctomycetota bacterium]MDP6764035.1 DEAD/DEAH box helicase [Planctomycetota bacterium]MDP6988003.1 DEAD/DEAH box helicase [Planctomycetota bacterium]
MSVRPDNPLIVQGDRSLMLHTVCPVTDDQGRALKDDDGQPMTREHPRFAEARDALSQFAELEKSPDYLHTYRITPVSVWNAAALGLDAQTIAQVLEEYACVPVPPNVLQEVGEWIERYGVLRIVSRGDRFELESDDPAVLADVLGYREIARLVENEGGRVLVPALARGTIKQALMRVGYPVDDRGGYLAGDALEISLRERSLAGEPFAVRPYQELAAQGFYAGGSVLGGNGVVALPCGAGKTIVGMRVMSLVRTKTLILTTNTVAVHQWRRELLDKTELREDQVGEYTGEGKSVCDVTISTYQMLTWRRTKTEEFEHFGLFSRENWGLVIYDEVHLLPAPVFRVTADLQARRRLGLTATLVREDGKEDEVFCLIGPKRYDIPWKVLEQQGFIAPATCIEVRVPLDDHLRSTYASADARGKFRVASENPAKDEVVDLLVERHADGRVLVIGQYLSQLESLARRLKAPLITGKTPNADRQELYQAFRQGSERLLVVSKVGNFAIDLPDANVAIQVSGTFGSRQEEAQRLGRILRPKSDGSGAVFYSVVTLGSRDQEFAEKRQLFLTEQGYTYQITEPAHFVESLEPGAPA